MTRGYKEQEMTRKFAFLAAAFSLSWLLFMVARANERSHKVNLPTSKTLTLPVPGFIARTNSYPATIAVSPDGRYAALLNQGYGTEQSGVRQSIAILDLSNNQLRDFPDERLRGDEKATLRRCHRSRRTASRYTASQTDKLRPNVSSPFLRSGLRQGEKSLTTLAELLKELRRRIRPGLPF
jgi:Leucine-rich repeat (LRR) protein